MGKKKDNLDALRRDDPKDNNWEIPDTEKKDADIPDPAGEVSQPMAPDAEKAESVKFCQKEFSVFGRHFSDGGKLFINLIGTFVQKCCPEDLWKDNPVWHFSICDDHITVIFKDGRKQRINL